MGASSRLAPFHEKRDAAAVDQLQLAGFEHGRVQPAQRGHEPVEGRAVGIGVAQVPHRGDAQQSAEALDRSVIARRRGRRQRIEHGRWLESGGVRHEDDRQDGDRRRQNDENNHGTPSLDARLVQATDSPAPCGKRRGRRRCLVLPAIIRPAQTVARFFLPPSPRGPGKRRAAGVELRSGFFGTHTPYGSATSRPRATTAMPLSRFTASFVTQA